MVGNPTTFFEFFVLLFWHQRIYDPEISPCDGFFWRSSGAGIGYFLVVGWVTHSHTTLILEHKTQMTNNWLEQENWDNFYNLSISDNLFDNFCLQLFTFFFDNLIISNTIRQHLTIIAFFTMLTISNNVWICFINVDNCDNWEP